MEFYKIETGYFKLDGGAMFGVVPKVLWQKIYPADENNQCNLAMRSLLIKDGEKLILIDTGLGDKQEEKFIRNFGLFGDDTMEKSFAKTPFTFEDVTDVILTHLHFDHCGGVLKYNKDKTQFISVFKNAKIWCSQQQWDLAMKPNAREKASFLKENIYPILETKQLQLFDKNFFLTPNVELRLSHGHTLGLILVYINYNNKNLVFTADLLPIVAHIPAAWVMSYDTYPLVTIDEKTALLNEALEKNQTLFFQHDFYTECCTLKQTEKGIRMDNAFKFEDFVF
jgi:glyoxylase-like metal-dependent hydrolase (beta-lactamase superfamily II)